MIGKSREGQPVGSNRGRRRKLRLNAGNGCIDVLQGLEHVHVPAEIEIDFRRAAAGNGAYGQQPGNAIDRFFERARDGDHHLIDRHHAVVHADQYPREVGLGKYGDWDGEGEISSQQSERQDQEDDGARVLRTPNRGGGPWWWSSRELPPCYLSSDPSVAVFASPAAGFPFSPSAGASGVWILILVLSGRP